MLFLLFNPKKVMENDGRFWMSMLLWGTNEAPLQYKCGLLWVQRRIARGFCL